MQNYFPICKTLVATTLDLNALPNEYLKEIHERLFDWWTTKTLGTYKPPDEKKKREKYTEKSKIQMYISLKNIFIKWHVMFII